LAQTETGKLEKQRAEIKNLTEAYEQGLITEQEYYEGTSALLKQKSDEAQKANQFADQLGLTFSSAFEDAIVSGKGFSDILKGVEQDILRMIIRLQVTKPLADSISKSISGASGGGIGEFFSGLFSGGSSASSSPSFAGGGYTGTGSRSGGLDGQGGFMAMLHPNETVVDHAMGQGLGGGGAVTVNVINQGSQMQVTGQSSRQNSDGSTTIDVMIAAVESGLADRMGAGVGSLFQATNSRFVPQGAM
jgi:hypothetical protein